MRILSALTLAALLASCGGSSDTPADAANGPDAPPGPDATPQADASDEVFALSSTAVVPGQLIDDKYTCKGDNVSPPLTWTEGPSGTASYAIVFTDLDNGPGGFIHSAIWDMSAATLALPEHVENAAQPAVPAGARQCRGYDGDTYGYLGPCPGRVHHYQFKLYALDVSTLPGVSTSSSLGEVVAALGGHTLATATLDITSD